ncbi:MAG: hypothetical protein V3S93_00820 [Methyloceanibacter sp.]
MALGLEPGQDLERQVPERRAPEAWAARPEGRVRRRAEAPAALALPAERRLEADKELAERRAALLQARLACMRPSE